MAIVISKLYELGKIIRPSDPIDNNSRFTKSAKDAIRDEKKGQAF